MNLRLKKDAYSTHLEYVMYKSIIFRGKKIVEEQKIQETNTTKLI